MLHNETSSPISKPLSLTKLLKGLVLSTVLLLWILFGLLLEIFIISWLTSGSLKQRLIRLWHQITLIILGIRVKVSGRFDEQAHLLCSNHISWLDIIIIGSVVPARFIAKQEVRNWPLLGTLATLAGTIFIQRGSGKQQLIYQKISQSLCQSNKIVFFPEGTTTDGQTVLPFKPFIFRLAALQCLSIQPICLHYTWGGLNPQTLAYVGEKRLIENLWSILTADSIEVELITLEVVQSPMLRGFNLIGSQQTYSDPIVKSIARDIAFEAQKSVHETLMALIHGAENRTNHPPPLGDFAQIIDS